MMMWKRFCMREAMRRWLEIEFRIERVPKEYRRRLVGFRILANSTRGV